MFARVKTRKNKNGSKVEYLQIVENNRVNGTVKQDVICTLGRVDDLQNSGQIDRLVEGLVRFAKEKELVALSQDSLFAEWSRDAGPVMVFQRLWDDCGVSRIIKERARTTKIEFDLVEAVFAMVLNRISEPGSKVQVAEWAKNGVYAPQLDNLELHHYYRALDFLAEHKNAIEEELFFASRDLFNQCVDLVFFDTTTTYFEGPTAAASLCDYGFSKDHRPDRVQVVIGLLIDQNGTPIAHEVFPGNTADVNAFLQIIKSCKERFNIRRVIMVGDRGMVSSKTIAELEKAEFDYILGVKMRRGKEVQEQVLTRAGRYKEVKKDLFVKNVVVDDNRYVICYNPEEAKRDSHVRQEILDRLPKKLAEKGAKSLIGNREYARYLKVDKDGVEIDLSKADDEARYDGKYILRTNTNLPADEVAMAYKQLWRVERAFRDIKSNLELRPMYHWTERRIRGHIMVCFLAFYMEMYFRQRLAEVAPEASYSQVLKDLSYLKAISVKRGENSAVIRTELQGTAHLAFKAAHMQVPSRVLRA